MKTTVKGIHAPEVRLTTLGAALVAAALAVPGGVFIGLISWMI